MFFWILLVPLLAAQVYTLLCLRRISKRDRQLFALHNQRSKLMSPLLEDGWVLSPGAYSEIRYQMQRIDEQIADLG